MSYSAIDPVLDGWAARRSITVFRECQGEPRRFFHISSAGETFQIVLGPERDGAARIDAWLIEGLDDQEAHFTWEVPAGHVGHALDLAEDSIRRWFSRHGASRLLYEHDARQRRLSYLYAVAIMLLTAAFIADWASRSASPP